MTTVTATTAATSMHERPARGSRHREPGRHARMTSAQQDEPDGGLVPALACVQSRDVEHRVQRGTIFSHS
jgi:hypothetical protein